MNECGGWREYLRSFEREAHRCDGAGLTCVSLCVCVCPCCNQIPASPTCVGAIWGPRQARREGGQRQSVCMLIHLLIDLRDGAICAEVK